ncbi:uncharacterized protein METZ01_LOCUS21172 [marine metagenome]|uniref:Uncharacterized protein n=1 Tax=marine metagenome TaxID=408172 RepID=A0A381PPB8_9ZZZZ
MAFLNLPSLSRFRANVVILAQRGSARCLNGEFSRGCDGDGNVTNDTRFFGRFDGDLNITHNMPGGLATTVEHAFTNRGTPFKPLTAEQEDSVFGEYVGVTVRVIVITAVRIVVN